MAAYFSPALFGFLRQLKAHNTRDWFLAHRDRYAAAIEQPMQRFITDLGPRLAALSPAFVVDPRRTGGSMYRIYRDTRFSADKSPYKTHVAASFAHREKKQQPSVPGFYLHLEPGDSMGGGGIYHPDMPALNRIRLAIVHDRPDDRRRRAEAGARRIRPRRSVHRRPAPQGPLRAHAIFTA